MALTSQQQQDIIKYAVGLYGASAGGYFAELASYVAGGMTATQLAKALAGSNSFKNLSFAYSDGSTNDQFATAFLNNLLGSSVTAGTMALAKTWFLNQITANGRAQAVVNAIDAVFTASPTDPDLGNAQKQLVNKIDVASDYTINLGGTSTDLSKLQQTISTVTQDPTTATAAKTTNATSTGQTYALTTGVDTIAGGNATDIINGSDTTFTAMDSIDGGNGNDVLNLVDVAGNFNVTNAGATVKNVETANLRGTTGLTVDTNTWTGLTALNLTQSNGNLDVKAAGTTAVNISNTGATGGTIAVVGGSTQTLNVPVANTSIALSKATGAVDITVSKLGTATLGIDDGTSVKVTSTATNQNGTTGAITIGNTTKPSGAVTVVSNLTATAAAADTTTGGVITVNGGTSVSVTQTAAQAAMTTASTNSKIVQSKVVVNGGASTTDVTVAQAAAVTAANTVLAVTGTTEVNTLTFKALAAGETQIINGLTFTAGSAGTTAAETAFAFANLDNGAKQGYSTKGVYSGTFNSEAWTSGAVTGTSTVVFTATSTGTRTDLADTGTGADATVVVTTDGVAAVTATGKGGVDQGVVQITDIGYGTATADAIKTVSVDGYDSTAADCFVKSDALTSLTLANSTGKTFKVYNNTATSLDLTVNGLGAGSAVNLDTAAATYTTLKLHTATANSTANITAAAVTALTVDGTKTVDLTSSTFTALKTITVSGSAGITAVVNASANLTDVNASATSGANTVTIDATKATYEGGTGVDKVTTSAGISKAISLGDGNDVFTVASGVTSVTAAVSGGNGTDTLTMVAADAVTASGSAAWATNVTGFEKLAVTGATGTQSIDVAALGNYSYITSSASAGTLTLNNLASGGTLEITGNTAGTGYVAAIKDASTGTADSLNVVLSSSGALTGGTVTAANVESIKITATDTNTTAHTDTLTLVATKATGLTIDGNAGLTLTNVGNTALATINASALTGPLTVEAAGTVACTITGGSGADVLKASSGFETAVVDFASATTHAQNATVTLGGLTLKVDKAAGLTGAEIAAAFASIANNTKPADTADYSFTGALTNYTTGALHDTDQITFTSTISGNVTDLANSGTAVLTGVTVTAAPAQGGTTADVLIGGAGNDSLYANAGLCTLTGGDGYDTFYINAASLNVNSYATITDPTKGDYIVFNNTAGTETFKSAAVTLGGTAVFQDYANAAINTLAQGEIGWFQFGGNTYIVQDASNGTTFVNGTDYIVKLTGLVDLSLASFDSAEIAVRLG